MSITFDNDSDVIVYALEKIISFARETQYLFVANFVWWIAGITGLDSSLTIHIDNLVAQNSWAIQAVSTTPRDIARSVSASFNQTRFEEELLPRMERIMQKPRQNSQTKRTNYNGISKPSRKQRRKLAKQKGNNGISEPSRKQWRTLAKQMGKFLNST
jgi:hypothetical protein